MSSSFDAPSWVCASTSLARLNQERMVLAPPVCAGSHLAPLTPMNEVSWPIVFMVLLALTLNVIPHPHGRLFVRLCVFLEAMGGGILALHQLGDATLGLI